MDFLDFDFELGFDEPGIAGELEETVLEPSRLEFPEYVSRSNQYWQQIPLPEEISLRGTNLLASLDDETLLTMSATLITHVQRSEASSGLQVVSPRLVSLGGVAARTAHEKRTTDMFLVGSAANRNHDWPTLGEPLQPHLFPGEPIDAYPSDPAPRARTVSSGIMATGPVDDPITKALITGRALVDLQRRADVGGAPQALASVLAASWGIDPDEYEDLAEASLAPSGPLLRYAIRSDAVYPQINAPVQARKCITVGANTAGRQLYGEYSAIDWRRMRVLAEAVFYQSTRLEGFTLADMSLPSLPGNPRAPPNRPGVLQLRPLPGSVWSFDPRTFRLEITTTPDAVPAVRIPARVRAAVDRYRAEVRPVAELADRGAGFSLVPTVERNVVGPTSETIIRGYQILMQKGAAFSARGRTAVSAIRGFIYQCLSENTSLSAIRALWLARYMHETVDALNLGSLLDSTTTRHMASRLSDVTDDLRLKLGVEAGRRGSDLAGWWHDFSAQLPRELSMMAEGSGAWAIGISHMLLHPPTPRWDKLVRALAIQSHVTLARAHLADVRLPAQVGSADRSFQAAAAVARQLGASYGAFYGSMYEIACILSARLRRGGNKLGADKLWLAGLMWDIRAKSASSAVLHPVDGTSEEAGAFNGRHGRFHLTTAPYPAYRRWVTALNSSPSVKREHKQAFSARVDGPVSGAFRGKRESLCVIPVGSRARIYRYLDSPHTLALDIEKTLSEICEDVRQVMEYYDSEDMRVQAEPRQRAAVAVSAAQVDLSRFIPAAGTYWDVVASMDATEAQDVVDAVLRMDDADSAEIEARTYASGEELRRHVWNMVSEVKGKVVAVRDTVI